MMCGAVAIVGSVGRIEPGNDRVHAFRPVDGEGGVVVAASPAEQHHWAKPVNMIRMKMRQEQSFNSRGR